MSHPNAPRPRASRFASGVVALLLVSASALVAAPAYATIQTNATLTTTPAPVTTSTTVTFGWSAATSNNGPVTYDVTVTGSGAPVSATGLTGTSWTSPTLSEGNHQFRLVARDQGQAPGQAVSYSFRIDRTAPVVTISSPASNAVVSSVTVEGSIVEAGSGVARIVLSEGQTELARQNGAATTFSFPLALAAGPHSVTVAAVDVAGNIGTSTVTFRVAAATVSDAPTALTPSGVSNASAVPLSWTTVANAATYQARVAATVAGLDAATVTTVSCTVTAGVCASTGAATAEGAYAFQVRGVNSDGVAGPWSDAQTATLDRTAPSSSALVAPAAGALLTSSDVSVSFTESLDAVGPVSYSLRWAADSAVDGIGALSDAGATQRDALSATSSTLSLADGDWWIQVSAIDAAGNRSAWSTPRAVTVDSGDPVVAIAAPADDSVFFASLGTTVRVTASDAGGLDDLVVTIEDSTGSVVADIVTSGAITSGDTSVDLTQSMPSLTEGAYVVRAVATDRAGHSAEVEHAFIVDYSPPSVSLFAPAGSSRLSGTVGFHGFAMDTSEVARFTIEIVDATDTVVATVVSLSKQGTRLEDTWLFDTTTIPDGDYDVIVTAADALGSEFTLGVDITIDNTAPTAVLVSPTDRSTVSSRTVTLRWTGEANATYEVRSSTDGSTDPVTGALTAAGAGVAVGSATALRLSGLAEGTYFWQVRAIDSTGNVGPWATPFRVTVDLPDASSPNSAGETAVDDLILGDLDTLAISDEGEETGEGEGSGATDPDASTAEPDSAGPASGATGGDALPWGLLAGILAVLVAGGAAGVIWYRLRTK